jgi:hypothetical protein
MGLKSRSAGPRTPEEYFGRAAGWQEPIVARLRELVTTAVPDASLSMKWGAPVYSLDRPFAYVGCFSQTVNLGFLHGARLDDPHGVLRGTGKEGRHIPLKTIEDVDWAVLRPLLQQAATMAQE